MTGYTDREVNLIKFGVICVSTVLMFAALMVAMQNMSENRRDKSFAEGYQCSSSGGEYMRNHYTNHFACYYPRSSEEIAASREACVENGNIWVERSNYFPYQPRCVES